MSRTARIGFKPSAYQEGVFDFIRGGKGDGIVNAVAGSGKTTTLVEGAKLVRGSAIFVAFNKYIATTLGEKLDGTTMGASTIHSIGFRAYKDANRRARRVRVDERKYVWLIRDWMKSGVNLKQELPEGVKAPMMKLLKIINMARLTLTGLDDEKKIWAMAMRYNLDWDERLLPLARKFLAEGDREAEMGYRIDFTDMLWQPHLLKLQPATYQWVFTDECQDLSAAALDLVLKLRDAGGRMLFVGDPKQSIMMFAGADSRSYENIRERADARELPLSICYRCPRTHVELARPLVPQIAPRDGAPEGVVEYLGESDLIERVAEGDLVMCRRTAPLVKHCLRLIQRRVPARIKGRDIGEELASLALEIGEDVPFRRFADAVEQYRKVTVMRLLERNADTQVETVNDKCEAILAVLTGFNPATLDDLVGGIKSLFNDERAGVWFASIHRSKGLEENRTFILESEKLGLPHPRSNEEEAQQELNLKYVAYTRAKQYMGLLSEAAPKKDEQPTAPPVAAVA